MDMHLSWIEAKQNISLKIKNLSCSKYVSRHFNVWWTSCHQRGKRILFLPKCECGSTLNSIRTFYKIFCIKLGLKINRYWLINFYAYCFCPVCHYAILSSSLKLTFEQWVLELHNVTWIFPVIRPFRGYHYFFTLRPRPWSLTHFWKL